MKDAHIINLQSKSGTFTNVNGAFSIKVALGDELQISSIQHKTKIVVVKDNEFVSKNVLIYVDAKTYELDEFELKKHNLKGLLSIDLKSVPKDNTPKVDAISLGLPNANGKKLTQIERKLYTATSSSGGLPLNLLLNVISGRLRLLKEEARVVAENQAVTYMHKNYRFFIQSYYKISDEELYRFLYFCATDPSYKKQQVTDELKMIPFFKLMAKKFKQKNTKN